MTKLTLMGAQNNTTVVENEFIDQHMVNANGEYVKVYLLLLRHFGNPSETLTIARIADILEWTERDVIRALNYWKKQGLLEYETNTIPDAHTSETVNATVSARTAEPVKKEEPSKSAAPAKKASRTQSSRNRKEFKELLFVTEQYLGKTLSTTEIDTITYFYDTLQMSADLIEYLIEYCVETGHKSMHYIQKVALSWHEQNIKTTEEAKNCSVMYNKSCYSVLNAYGIKGRAPAASEIAYIKKWNEEYAFSLELILEACTRTMNAIHQPNFEYTDSILKNWHTNKVRSMNDVSALDAAYLKNKESKKKSASKPAGQQNKFNNFDSRSYDMSDLERRLIQQ